MKIASKLFLWLLLFFTLSFKNAHADTVVPGGNITSSTTWTLSGSPYIIQGNVTINSGITLTIEPGVAVKFDGLYSININGVLNAVGTPSSYIVFSSNNASPGTQDWQSINFASAQASASSLSYAEVRNGANAITLNNSSPSISNILATNNNRAFNITNSFASINNVTALSNDTGFRILSGSPTIMNSFIFNNNYGFVLQHTSSLVAPTVNNCGIYSNSARNIDNTGSFSSSASVNFQNNWWGTTDPAVISQSIWDHYDQEVRPYIDFTPFLDSQGGSPIGTPVTGVITQNTTWTASGSPYYISSIVTVNSGVTLTIEAGAAVRVESNYSLNINGILIAQGTPSNLITFLSVNPSPTLWYWLGLQLNSPESSASQISYIRISFANTGLVIKNGSSPSITNVQIYQNRTGIEIDRAGGADPNPVVQQSSLRNNSDKNVKIIGNYLDPSRLLNFEMNWWGSASESSIDLSIVDHIDNPNLPTIDYVPYLESEGGGLTTIYDVSRTPEALDHKLGESVSVNYSLGVDAFVTLRFMKDDGAFPVFRTLLASQFRAAGPHTEIWDGTNDQGQPVPYDPYFFQISAAPAQGGATKFWNDSFSTVPFVCITDQGVQLEIIDPIPAPPADLDFDPYKNQKLKITYQVIKTGKQSIRIRKGNVGTVFEIATLDESGLQSTGWHNAYWEGRFDAGSVYTGAYKAFFDIPSPLHGKAIILRSVMEPPREFLSNAYLILPEYGEASVLGYTLNESLRVTVTAKDPNGNHFKTLVDDELQAGGERAVIWDGRNDLGETAAIQGAYQIKVQVTHPVSGAIRDWTGSVTVYR